MARKSKKNAVATEAAATVVSVDNIAAGKPVDASDVVNLSGTADAHKQVVVSDYPTRWVTPDEVFAGETPSDGDTDSLTINVAA